MVIGRNPTAVVQVKSPQRHAGGAGGVADEAEGDDRDQLHGEQQGGAAALDRRLGPREALGAEPAVQQRPGNRLADREAERPGERPADHHQRQGGEEAVGETGCGVDDLHRVEDHRVQQGEARISSGPATPTPCLADALRGL
jgi:hypothetical protein